MSILPMLRVLFSLACCSQLALAASGMRNAYFKEAEISQFPDTINRADAGIFDISTRKAKTETGAEEIVTAVISEAAAADLVTDLPGQPAVNFSQYSGYVTINASTGKNFFYWLAEAEEPDNKPLVLWLNGGPGCSSVGGGMMTELGPWRVADEKAETLKLNPWSWNTVANMVFLESPAGVGFSYTDTVSDLTTGDNQTASDNYVFLQGFLQRHTRFQGRTFYITGESYAGHYIPQLAKKVLEENLDDSNIYIPLKGIAVGNGLTEVTDDVLRGPLLSYFDHALMSSYTWETLEHNCNFTWDYYSIFGIPADNATCNKAMWEAYLGIGDIDPYDIYSDSCTYLGATKQKTNLHKYLPGLRILNQIRNFATAKLPLGTGPAFTPYSLANPACLDVWTQTYLNREDVKLALHAKNLPVAWMDCSEILNYDYLYSFPQSIVPIYNDFITNYPDLQILVYSGDCDTVVPFVGTRKWLSTISMDVVIPYYAWYNKDQVGGYAEVYSGLTFATVRGAGHLVPLGQPQRALTMFRHFLKNELLPDFSSTELEA